MTAVLFTCAGQRVDIVDAFNRAGATTVAADVNALAPALYRATHRALVPEVGDEGYVAALRAPPRLAVALLPGLGVLGYLYFTVSYPTPDGDVLKASYMLTTAPAWALAFGYAVDRLPGRLRVAVAALLAASALAALPFLLY